jgi:hypothetical protein
MSVTTVSTSPAMDLWFFTVFLQVMKRIFPEPFPGGNPYGRMSRATGTIVFKEYTNTTVQCVIMQTRVRSTILRQNVLDLLTQHHDAITAKFHIRQIGLYGSVIRGEENEMSDIDILIDFETGYATLRNYMNLKRYLQTFFSRKVDLVTYGSLSPHIRPFVDREVVWVG